MIKAIIFDLDGVLVDARELHYEALNRALASADEKYVINRDEHLSTYDGLPTRKKLILLTQNKGLPEDKHDEIWHAKEFQTIEIIDKGFTYDDRMRGILKKLRDEGYLIAVCSNSIRESTKMMLLRKGLLEFCEFYLSNQDVVNPKPNPEMYLKSFIKLGIGPKECVIVEDSHVGRQSAFESGANLCAVENTDDVTYEKIRKTIDKFPKDKAGNDFKPKWQGGNLRIIIPMCGEGKRFKELGYSFPKPLIDINGKPMIQWVTENINAEAKFIFIVTKADHQKYNLKHMLNLLENNCEIIILDQPTQGAAETVLKAKDLFDDEDPIAIIATDQLLEWNSNEFFYAMAADECDGGIVTFESTHPKWSYSIIGDNGFVTETAEKKPISRNASAGVYYFKRGSDYIQYAKQMIQKGLTFENEYYVCPVYNEMIADRKKIRIFPIKKMWSFSTPEDVQLYLRRNN